MSVEILVENKQLREILDKGEDVVIEVSNEILGFSDIDPDYFKSGREVPPTPIAFFRENFIEFIMLSSNDLKGAWMRFVLFVYASGGKILFTKSEGDNFKAEVTWS